jgi:transglutaminase-like putative cysteine protease
MPEAKDQLARRLRFRRSSVVAVIAVIPLLVGAGTPDVDAPSDIRTFAFTYQARIGPIAAQQGPVHVFVPLPFEDAHQRVRSLEVDASIAGRVEREARYGNRFWHGFVATPNGDAIDLTVRSVVERRSWQIDAQDGAVSQPLADSERAELAQFLQANQRVAVGHPVLQPILAEVRQASPSASPSARARAIYEWVVDNMVYKKVGTGWGNGDTFWACSERYGNCTDFHALFISLARTEGIPARFEMGFPIPQDRPEGEIGGYHCWVQFYLPGQGWVPIDASEAFKHPERRLLYFGSQPTDRIHFTTGRDLRLGEGHQDDPLNYFIYPHVEVAGKRYEGPIQRSFRYQERSPGEILLP